ncbi:hypothetical protein GCM10011581_18380 [Saccharopolyspora subtropica]|uniref:DUF3558 domain-containing protein n=1 Tax=Saccharopolyspora thermophila TaxID=89367 RepID=A0A917N9R2_9PSEU|nr:hypothetical protein [Saccharopolyspora subtropica]GGI81312.1 hypothetical protein GCM10011581_18380 [Saccharopolyspora subtropica]
MSASSHRAWGGPIVGLVVAAMMFAGGCSVEPYTMPTSSDPTPTLIPGAESTPSGPPPGPVKYDFATFKTCSEIQQAVPDLPPPLTPQREESASRFSQKCTFATTSNEDKRYIAFRVELWENQRDRYGYHSAAELARIGFNATPLPGVEPETGLGFGSQAQWNESDVSRSCHLEVLDENAVMILTYYSGEEDQDPRSEQCRESARTLARQIHAAVQPQ